MISNRKARLLLHVPAHCSDGRVTSFNVSNRKALFFIGGKLVSSWTESSRQQKRALLAERRGWV